MNLESEFSIETASVLGQSGKTKVHNNGSCEAGSNGYNELLSDFERNGIEASDSVSQLPSEKKSEASPSVSMRKGYGLKKWKRIKRDARKVGESSVDTGKMVMQESPKSVVHPSKRAQVYAEKEQMTEGSVSSRNPVVGNLDGFALFSDPTLAMVPSMDVGTDSENSSSKSSTAASVPKVIYDMPVVVGFPHDRSRMRHLSGNDSAQKGRVDAIKKARGERMKTEKEISRSSIESDSRSSSYVFMPGPYATSNGMQSERPVNHDGENGDEVQGDRENEKGYEDISPQDLNADLSREDKKEKSDNHGSSSDQDPLVESILVLQTAQEALEKEVLKFKEIGKDTSVDDSVSDAQPEITDVGKNFQQSSFEHLPSGDGVPKVLRDMIEIAKRDAERELEDLFKQRIEAEIEYLAISRTVRKLRVPALDQITCLKEHKMQNQIHYKNGDKDKILKRDSDNLEGSCEENANSKETMKLQKKVCKYTLYFFVQLLSLLIVVGVLIFELSPNYVDVIPT